MEAVHEEYWSVDEVAERLKVSGRTVRRWIEDGELVAIKLAPGMQGRVRIAESDLKAFLDSRRKKRS